MNDTFSTPKLNKAIDGIITNTLPTRLRNFPISAVGYFLEKLFSSQTKPVIIITEDLSLTNRLVHELTGVFNNLDIPILSFSDWETLPYDNFSPHQDIISDRLSVFYKLPKISTGVFIISISSLMHRICPEDYVIQNSLVINTGELININKLTAKLQNCGYQNVSQVVQHGEYSVRGSIIDIFPMGSNCPYRIDLFDDEIDSIRKFDPETQKSIEKIKSIKLLPAREYSLTKESITFFRQKWRDKFGGDSVNCSIYQEVSKGINSPGLEYYLPLFFDKLFDLTDYLPKDSIILQLGDINKKALEFWQQIKVRYEQYRHDISRPILNATEIFLDPTEILAKIKNFKQVLVEDNNYKYDLGISSIILEKKLYNYLSKYNRVIFTAESKGRKEILQEILNKNNIEFGNYKNIDDFVKNNKKNGLIISDIEEGFALDELNLAVITEAELFGNKVQQKRRRKSRIINQDLIVKNLQELNIGEPVVHIEHGIGRYKGLTTLSLSNITSEFVIVEYAKGSKLYIPVSSLHLISRYSGADLENAPIHNLGSDKWDKEKKKAAKQIKDIAAQLLEVYAKRKSKQGYKFCIDEQDYFEFCNKFQFEETPDQAQAIENVLSDLKSNKTMDRVICGDVGFGKTEVAMRAAFVVANNSKQVAILVPTTLLAEQHYRTFLDRFADFPMQVRLLSRFVNKSEQNKIIEEIKMGTCDIVIGTHKILQKNIQFKDLGLLILDEEHRFGVEQKEKFKSMRAEVDILTLTATPIPRTLNMAMNGVRDLSIISTPPLKRLSVKTFVREYNNSLIQESILRELRRGGQVYFLHNSVDTIENKALEIEKLIPEAKIAIGHGQLAEKELEKVMADFYHRRANVLVCTTIIETGIDIPTANTIIIDRADKLGLAQLHQLRGRVGRSHHQAYALCLTPSKSVMTKDAIKRLEAIESLDVLGAGFTLATHDLEIRGAGELLGQEQSGNMQTIGFSLYMELLEKTVKLLESGANIKEADIDLFNNSNIEIDLQIPAFIPNDFILDVQTRLVIYKRISDAKNEDELNELKSELIDRFGKLLEPIKNLFILTKIKFLANDIGIKIIKLGKTGGKIEFNSKPNINPDKIISLISNNPKIYQFAGSTGLNITKDLSKNSDKVDFIIELLNRLID